MEEKEKKISRLETEITIYSVIGWVFVGFALIPIGQVVSEVFIQKKPWPEADLGTFLGGVSGTFAALAGVFFVFVAFLGQRISIIQQQIELQDNRKELQETREEIKGQKEQLELQNKQFKIQAIENNFFRLLQLHRDSFSLDLIIKMKLNFVRNFPADNKLKIGESYMRLKDAGAESEIIEYCNSIDGLLEGSKLSCLNFLRSIICILNSFPLLENNYHRLFSTLKHTLSDSELYLIFYLYFYTFKSLSDEEKDNLYILITCSREIELNHETHGAWFDEVRTYQRDID